MRRAWWYVVLVTRWGHCYITVSDDPDLDWAVVAGEFRHYDEARDFCAWLIEMRDG